MSPPPHPSLRAIGHWVLLLAASAAVCASLAAAAPVNITFNEPGVTNGFTGAALTDFYYTRTGVYLPTNPSLYVTNIFVSTWPGLVTYMDSDNRDVYSFTINIPNGFRGSFTLNYAAPYYDLTGRITDAINNAGNVLAAFSMPVNTDAYGNLQPLQLVEFNGTARSITLTGRLTFATFDDLYFGDVPSSCDGFAATASVPAPICNSGVTSVTIGAANGTQPYAGAGDFNITAGGPFTFNVTDASNCLANVSVSAVLGPAVRGFFSPVDNLPTINTVKGGQAVPVKFSLGCYAGLAIFAPGYPRWAPVACPTSGVLDPIGDGAAALAPGASALSYDASVDTYTWVWKTPNTQAAGSCATLVVRFADGVQRSAVFKFR